MHAVSAVCACGRAGCAFRAAAPASAHVFARSVAYSAAPAAHGPRATDPIQTIDDQNFMSHAHPVVPTTPQNTYAYEACSVRIRHQASGRQDRPIQHMQHIKVFASGRLQSAPERPAPQSRSTAVLQTCARALERRARPSRSSLASASPWGPILPMRPSPPGRQRMLFASDIARRRRGPQDRG